MIGDPAGREARTPRVRIAWHVLVLRIVATVAVVSVALGVTVFVQDRHSWKMEMATMVCPERPHTDVHSVRVSSSWGEGVWCTYVGADGRQVADSLVAESRGETNVFEPRFSFVVSAVVVLATWFGAVAVIRLIWLCGRVIRRPRPAPFIPVPA